MKSISLAFEATLVKTALIDLDEAPKKEKIGRFNRKYRETEFLSAIVSASTLAPAGSDIDTSIRCRKRPDHRQCSGLIHVHLRENPAELRWWCPVCGEQGSITNWKGIPWQRAHKKSSLNNKQYCEILLGQDEFYLLKEISILESGAENIVRNAVQSRNGVLLMGTAGNVDTLAGYIAFEANHEARPRRQQVLTDLFDKICCSMKK